MAQSGATGTDLAVGRAEWSLLPQPTPNDSTVVYASSSGEDRIGGIIDAAREAGLKNVRFTVDTMLTNTLQGGAPEEASVSADGTVQDSLPSAWALTEGRSGQMIEDQVRRAVEVYGDRIDGVVLTEIHWDSGSFSANDLTSFTADTGLDDWPRDSDGRPDLANPVVIDWLTDRMQMFISRIREVVGDVPLIVDVRVNWDSPLDGRPESGHDYGKLLDVADGIQVWAYPETGENRNLPALSASYEDEWPSRVVIALWAPYLNDSDPNVMIQSISDHTGGVQLTPWSRITRGQLLELGSPAVSKPEPEQFTPDPVEPEPES